MVCGEAGCGFGCGEADGGMAREGEVGEVAGEAAGAGCVEVPAPPEVALPRMDKTAANFVRFSASNTISAPKRKSYDLSMPCRSV